MKKIDVHAHLPTFRAEKAVWDLKRKMEEYDVEKTVILASYFPHKGTGLSNYRLYDIVRDHEGLDMFGSLDFGNYFRQGVEELASLAEMGRVCGVKVYTGYQDVDLKSDNLKRLFSLVETYGMPVMFHTGYSFMAQRMQGTDSYTSMVGARELEFLVDSWPEVQFILSHLSKPYFNDMIDLAKKYTNVYTDMSGLIDSTHEQAELPDCVVETKRFLGEVGPTKLLFGTDYPVQTHEDSVYIVEEAMMGFSDDDKDLVYRGNVRRLLWKDLFENGK